VQHGRENLLSDSADYTAGKWQGKERESMEEEAKKGRKECDSFFYGREVKTSW